MTDGEQRARRRLIIETDGGARGNPGPAGWGAVIRSQDGEVLAERADFLGVTTNNVAEYSGLVAGLRAARAIDPGAEIEVRADSKLLVEQMSGRWQIKHEAMRRLAAEARSAFPPERVTYKWIPRAQNSAADALANEAMDLRIAVVRDREPDSDPEGDERRGASGPGPSTSGSGRPHPGPPRALGSALHLSEGDPVTVVLVRHGQTDMTAARCYAGGGTPGAALNARGRTEAARAADLVHRIGDEAWPDLPRPSAVVSSTMLRSQQTAAALGRRLGVEVELDDAFEELRFGEWEGLTAPEIEARWPGQLGRWHADPVQRARGGESMQDVADRVGPALHRLLDTHAGRTVVVATHTIVIRTAAGTVAGVEPHGWSLLRIPPASLTILRLWPDAHEITVLGCPSDL